MSQAIQGFFNGFSPEQKLLLVIAVLVSVLVFACTAMITKTVVNILGIKLNPGAIKEDGNDE